MLYSLKLKSEKLEHDDKPKNQIMCIAMPLTARQVTPQTFPMRADPRRRTMGTSTLFKRMRTMTIKLRKMTTSISDLVLELVQGVVVGPRSHKGGRLAMQS
jgi:hypothetical protein